MLRFREDELELTSTFLVMMAIRSRLRWNMTRTFLWLSKEGKKQMSKNGARECSRVYSSQFQESRRRIYKCRTIYWVTDGPFYSSALQMFLTCCPSERPSCQLPRRTGALKMRWILMRRWRPQRQALIFSTKNELMTNDLMAFLILAISSSTFASTTYLITYVCRSTRTYVSGNGMQWKQSMVLFH